MPASNGSKRTLASVGRESDFTPIPWLPSWCIRKITDEEKASLETGHVPAMYGESPNPGRLYLDAAALDWVNGQGKPLRLAK